MKNKQEVKVEPSTTGVSCEVKTRIYYFWSRVKQIDSSEGLDIRSLHYKQGFLVQTLESLALARIKPNIRDSI